MRRHWIVVAGGAAGALLLAGLLALAGTKQAHEERERQVKEDEVPRVALEALRRLADKASITEFAEEIEHGHTFYEGSWTGPDGNVDALVTASGDLVEIEEIVPADRVPAAVRLEVEKAAGKDAKLTFEKKTLVMYEVHYRRAGKGQERIFAPDGRRYLEEGAGDEDEEDEEGE